MADPGVMSERVFLGASGELGGSLPPDGGEEDGAAGEEQGRMGRMGGRGGEDDRLVGVEQSAEVRMGTEVRPGSEEGEELGINDGRLWW